MTSFSKLLADLQAHDPESPLVFITGDREIGAGYHVTELRHSHSKGIDCGGNIESWQETRLQLLDGNGREHMSVGKFCDIVSKSLTLMPELETAPMLVEFALENKSLKLMTVSRPATQTDRVVLRLGESGAVCKPAQRSKGEGGESDACCGTSAAATSAAPCCGSDASGASASACCS